MSGSKDGADRARKASVPAGEASTAAQDQSAGVPSDTTPQDAQGDAGGEEEMRIARIFRDLDLNGDSRISIREFQPYAVRLGYAEDAVAGMFDHLDSDGDGEISLPELLHFFRKERGRMSKDDYDAFLATAAERRLRATANGIPEVSRQIYQDAALCGLISVGQEVPDDWMPGDQFDFSADRRFKVGEIVVVVMPDGNLKFGKITNRDSSASLTAKVAAGTYSVAIAVNRLGTKYLELAAEKVGKILPLSQREIQRLGRSDLSTKKSTATVIKNGGLFSSIRDMVDVDKTMPREETLPFQPMLSRRAAASPAVGPKSTRKAQTRVSSVMSGADSGDWGELDGWWRNEQDQTDTFEVLLQRPLGMELDEVEGEAIFVKTLEEDGNAQRAGVRVGDRVQVPGSNTGWRDDLVSVLSAISESSGNRMRMRYVRSVSASTPPLSLSGADLKQKPAGTAERWRAGAPSTDGFGAYDVTVSKPIGMRLTEIERRGIYVSQVVAGGNAAIAGIRVGDRVVETSTAPGFESGVAFDRGTTYFSAVYSKTGPTALQRFISEVKAPGGGLDIGLERSREGQTMMEQFVARERLGGVDVGLSAKVKRVVLAPFMAQEEGQDPMRGVESAASGDEMVSAGRVLSINLDLLSYSARRAMQQGNTTLGEELYVRCTQVDPWDGRGWVGLAKFYKKRAQFGKAREILMEGLKKSADNPYLLQSLGSLEAHTGNLAAANTRFQQATSADPSHAASWVAWGKLEERFRRPQRARQCYAKAAREDSSNYYAWQCLAVLETKSGDLDAARALFKKCTDVNPHNAASWQAWGTMERQAGRIDEAANLFARAVRASPKNTWVLQALALLEWDRGHFTQAEALFTKALVLKPWDGGLYQTWAVLLQKSGDVQRARVLFQEGSLRAKDHAALWQAWALMEAEAGKIAEARALFQQGVWGAGSSPKVYNLWQAWGLLEAKQENLDDARKYLARAVDCADRPATTLLAWALVEERLGAVLKGRELMEKAVSLEGTNPLVWAGYLRFTRRIYGDTSAEAADVYQRQVVAEIRTRSDREEAFPQLSRNGRQGTNDAATGSPRDIIVREDDLDVVMKAKWGSPLRRGQGSGWTVAESST